jgi:hypothetical protein
MDADAFDAGAVNEAVTPSFTEIYSTIVEPSCSGSAAATASCHNAADTLDDHLDMSTQAVAYGNLVANPPIPASGFMCSLSGYARVVPGKPSESLFYLKVSEPTPPCGFQMPTTAAALTGSTMASTDPLTSDQLTLISTWITEGAPNN